MTNELIVPNQHSDALGFDPGIFKTYDIRGIYPTQINEEIAYLIGRAYATLIKKESRGEISKVAVGSDMRLSSPGLKQKVIEGILDSGVSVDDLGLVSTPTFYFGVAYFGYEGGLQVSASHNPKEWNGMKVVRKNASPVSKEGGLDEIKKIILEQSFYPLAEERGILGYRDDVLMTEVNNQTENIDLSGIKNFKIVADGANAMGSLDLEALFTKIPVNLIKMNFELDGNFPAHEADPSKPENNKSLCEAVLNDGADLGIAPDGDGDRIFFIDEKGIIIAPSVIRGLMAQIELKEHPHATVAYDVRPGRITKDMIDQFGGRAVVTPVGHSLIKEIMIKEDAIFGGESSGHYFYKFDYGVFESPMVLISKFLKYVSDQNKPLSEVIRPFLKYSNSGEINIRMPDRNEINAKITEIEKAHADGKQTHLDGISIEYPDYWFNVRASNTEPLIRLIVEAINPEVMNREVERLRKMIVGAI